MFSIFKISPNDFNENSLEIDETVEPDVTKINNVDLDSFINNVSEDSSYVILRSHAMISRITTPILCN